ncbi:uncharacterized protein involved in response to NO [Marinospirillum celere]|uniref:Uncharacterized protein involved in response to NO n=1 Tax=Marinospirillum celere TaxID=1122252 RepID=A0A1I1HZI4_9GAMM|nr:NnrS family protein [Marinospirillum celere]SFC26863.1 uncharacterized protein involved in response to NO [Marinospirillum celere]
MKSLHPLFSLGFRPFFLLAALLGSGLMLVWLLMLTWGLQLPGVNDPLAWHSHEMLFGYTGAVIAGFLLTAVRRWTGKLTPDGLPLLILAGAWLLARLVPLISNWSWLYALVDLLFWLGLWISLWPALKAAEWRNRVFLLLLAGLFLAAGLSHAGKLGWGSGWLGHLGVHLGLDLVLIIMLTVANRVLPFFIQLGLQRQPFDSYAWLDRPLPWLLGLLVAVHLLWPMTPWSGLINLLLAALLLPRLYLWWDRGVWQKPLLWSLYLAYAWLVFGLILRGLGMLELVNPYLGIHALTVGGLGLLTLSMMSRVGLGHTGRALQASPWIVLALLMLLAAACIRVLTVQWLGLLAYQVSAGLWSLALLIYFFVYWPVLTQSDVSSSSSRNN